MMYSKKLSRQIKKAFGDEEFSPEVLAAAASWAQNGENPGLQSTAEKLKEFGVFLENLDKTFAQNETMLDLANRSLEVSTRELYDANEKAVFLNRAITAMLNSLDEGFLVIDRIGTCSKIISLAAKQFIGHDPAGENIADIFSIEADNRESFAEWLEMVFDEVIAFQDLIALAPKFLKTRDENQIIEVSFKPIRALDGKIQEVVIILKDVAEIFEAEKSLKGQKSFTEMVIKYLNGKSNFQRMIQMTRETADLMRNWEFNGASETQTLEFLTRQLHTIKGGLNMLSIDKIGSKVHEFEDQILAAQKQNSSLPDMVILIRAQGQELADEMSAFLNKHKRVFKFDTNKSVVKEVPANSIYKFSDHLLKTGLKDLLDHYVREIVEVPVMSMFAPIDSNVFSISIQMGKNVEFLIKDPKEIRVIPEFYTSLFEQMIHLFNNIVDHGIEFPEERQVREKSLEGKINVTIDAIDGDKNLVFCIEDDGRGIDPVRIRERLDRKGINHLAESDEEVIYHILDQGISTKEHTTEMSGRGVGMASLYSEIINIGGRLALSSKVNFGTKFEITVPYIRELNQGIIQKAISDDRHIKSA